jgi:hypothetical protein
MRYSMGLRPRAPFALFLTLLLCASARGQDHTRQTGSAAGPASQPQKPDVAAASAALGLAGSLAQIASAGGWDTSLTLVNLGATAGEARLHFYANDGSALTLPFTFPGQPALGTVLGATFDQALNANATLAVDTTGPTSQEVAVGSAQLLTSGNIGGFGIFKATSTGQEAMVPLETRNATSYVLAFDDTGSLTTGVAIANLASTAANVGVVIRDDTGTRIGTGAISLPPQGHSSFMLPDPAAGFPITASKRGTLEVDPPQGGQIAILGLRANGNALTSLPVLANVPTGGGTMAQVASGGGWQTFFTLVNTGAATANVTLKFSGDDGSPLSLPLSFPQTGTTATESSVSQAIPAGGSLVIATQGQESAGTAIGSAQLSTTGNVSGFAIFQANGQEAVVPLQSFSAGAYTLAFDNTNGLATGVALVNSSGQPAVIPATLRDMSGATLATTTIALPAGGHHSEMLTDLFVKAANARGTLEFDTPAGGRISALGIRATPAGAFTTIPVMTTGAEGAAVAERALAQTGLAIAQATEVLQSQVAVLGVLTGLTPSYCNSNLLSGGGSVQSGPTANAVTVYYDAHCRQPYLVANISSYTPGQTPIVIAETATYYGLSGDNIGSMPLRETAQFNSDGSLNVYGLGAFTPAGSARTPAQLGLYCAFGSSTTAQCAGGIAQDFPALGLAIGAVTTIALTVGQTASAPVSFTGAGSTVTGPSGSLTLTNPSPTSLVIQGGTSYTTTIASGGAAAFALFPPTPTAWTLTDAAHDQQFQISVVDNTTRNLTLTIVQKSSGSVLATGALDQSGSGTIWYSDGSIATITNWTLGG